MKVYGHYTLLTVGFVLLASISLFFPKSAAAHCDTMDGPVVKAAEIALAKGDVTPVLKWVQKDDEEEIHRAFNRTLSVRNTSSEARELADMYFFETLVRIHRAGEGAPYTGLKPAGTKIDPVIDEADRALGLASVDNLTTAVQQVVVQGIKKRFKHALESKVHAEESVEAGREFVEAYV